METQDTPHFGPSHNLVLFVIFVVFIMLLYFIFVKFANPQATIPTAKVPIKPSNVKTYTNQPMGFSVKLPQNWYGHAEVRSGEKIQAVFSYPVDSNNAEAWIPNQQARISVIQYPNDGNDVTSQAKQWLAGVEKTNPNTYEQLPSSKIGGRNAVIIENKVKHAEYIYVTNGEYTYYITLSTPTDDPNTAAIKAVPFEKYQKVFNQILSTFIFT